MTCAPYNDGALMTAQVLSILAFILSIGYGLFVGFFLGLTSMILLQVVWCCRMEKCGLVTAGVFGALAGLACFVSSGLIFTHHEEICSRSFRTTEYESFGTTECNYTAWGIVAIVAGLLWTVVCVLTLVFTSNRMDQFLEQQPVVGGGNASAAPAVAVPFAAAPQASTPAAAAAAGPPGGTSTVTTTLLPDGSKQVETVTVNKDGSKTVEVVTETPN